MDDEARDLDNLSDYLMRADHARLAQFARALAMEFAARGLWCDVTMFELARGLDRITSAPRAEPLARP